MLFYTNVWQYFCLQCNVSHCFFDHHTQRQGNWFTPPQSYHKLSNGQVHRDHICSIWFSLRVICEDFISAFHLGDCLRSAVIGLHPVCTSPSRCPLTSQRGSDTFQSLPAPNTRSPAVSKWNIDEGVVSVDKAANQVESRNERLWTMDSVMGENVHPVSAGSSVCTSPGAKLADYYNSSTRTVYNSHNAAKLVTP